jgi:hypothetical protein
MRFFVLFDAAICAANASVRPKCVFGVKALTDDTLAESLSCAICDHFGLDGAPSTYSLEVVYGTDAYALLPSDSVRHTLRDQDVLRISVSNALSPLARAPSGANSIPDGHVIEDDDRSISACSSASTISSSDSDADASSDSDASDTSSSESSSSDSSSESDDEAPEELPSTKAISANVPIGTSKGQTANAAGSRPIPSPHNDRLENKSTFFVRPLICNSVNQKRPSEIGQEISTPVQMQSLAAGYKKRRSMKRQASHFHFNDDDDNNEENIDGNGREADLYPAANVSLIPDAPIDYDMGEPAPSNNRDSVWTKLIEQLPSIDASLPLHPGEMILYRQMALGEVDGAWGPCLSGWFAGRLISVSGDAFNADILWRQEEQVVADQDEQDSEWRRPKPRELLMTEHVDTVHLSALIDLKKVPANAK